MSHSSRLAGRGGPTPKPVKVSTNCYYCITPLPLVASLKKALVFSGAEGHIPPEHARRLLALFGLQEV
jgi:hypothetical protein